MLDLARCVQKLFGREVRVDIPARATAYRRALGAPEGRLHILPDILQYTGVLTRAPLLGDAFAQGRAQGRRDVGLHILENLALEPDELYAVLRGQSSMKPGDFPNG